MNSTENSNKEISFIRLAFSQIIVMRAFKVSMLVGTILALINHGEKIFEMTLSTQDFLKIVLTYIVPYGVSTWSAVSAIKASTEK